MGNTTTEEKTVKQIFVGKCWQYLNDNFHKFTEPNKIKIALTMAQKDLPQVVEGAVTVHQMGEVKVADKPLDYNIGEEVVDSSEDTGDTEQAVPDSNTV